MNPSDKLYRLWAKTNEIEDDYTPESWQRHPLPLHLIDVGHVAESWLDADPLLFDRFCALLPGAERAAVRRVLILAAALHDLGKVHRLFQAKSEKGWNAGYATLLTEPRPDGTGFDHGAATAAQMKLFIEDEIIGEAYARVRSLLEAAAGHHGRLYPGAVLEATPISVPAGIPGRLALALIEEIEYHFGSMPRLPVRPGNDFCMLAAGFVSVADWIGSDSRTFRFAPEVSSREEASDYLRRLRAGRTAGASLRQAGLIAEYVNDLPDFATFFGFPDPLPLQRVAATIPFGDEPGPEIALVEEFMGGGKTEIAQYLTARALTRHTAAGLYFALPTQASANALFKRMLSFTERVATGRHIAIVLAHGGRHFFASFRKLLEKSKWVPFGRTTSDSRDEPAVPSEVIATSWLMPTRKALLAPIGLGTIDQAMLGALSVRHAFVRLFALGRKVVVFDEIHAYDAYMNQVIFFLLRWLRVLGAKVILLSATLPDTLRRDLLATYGVCEPEHDGDFAPYPQVLHARAGAEARVFTPEASDSSEPKKPITLEVRASSDVTADGLACVRALARQGGCIAWIRNTVREAQEAYRQLAGQTDAEVVLVHARFTRSDRNSIEEELVARLGKNPDADLPRPRRLIVIATQVIEQSVDLDFDAMVTDLAPADLLLQRAGRLHRHARAEAERFGHTSPRLFVLMPAAEDRQALRYGLSAYVYDPETLARTATLLGDEAFRTWPIPSICRALVNALYDRDESYWTADRLVCDPDRLAAVRQRAKRLKQSMEHAARNGRMPAPESAVLAMRDARRDSSDDGAQVFLTTRYGGHSATITLFHRKDGRVQPSGKPAELPQDEAGFAARLAVDEAFALSSVSFPWYEALPDPRPDDDLAPWATWWHEHHRYDARLFAVLDESGKFDLPEAGLHGRYTAREGLVIERADRDLPEDPSGYSDQPPYSAL